MIGSFYLGLKHHSCKRALPCSGISQVEYPFFFVVVFLNTLQPTISKHFEADLKAQRQHGKDLVFAYQLKMVALIHQSQVEASVWMNLYNS